MRILLFHPDRDTPYFIEEERKISLFHHLITKLVPLQKHLSLPLLAGATDRKHEIELLEGGFSTIDFNKKYDLVGIHCVTSTALIAYRIADEFRKRGVKVVLGGWHASALPEEAKQHVDSVVVGEAEETWPELLKDLEKGQLKSFYYQKRPVDPKIIPYPRDLFPTKGRMYGIQATRGCPNGCKFCCITNMKYRNIFRMRPIENVINELKSLSGSHFAFHDNSLTLNPKYIKDLFREIKKQDMNKTFSAFGNVEVLSKDEELLELAKEAGCIQWFIGFESISQQTLNNLGKTKNKVKEYKIAIKKIHDYGMTIRGTFILGLDEDTLDVFRKTDDFVKESDMDFPEPLILTPYPGTPIFDRFERERRILTHDWSKYDWKHVVFQPKNMTPEELLINNKELFEGWYTNPIILKRNIKYLKKGLKPFISTLSTNYMLKAWM